LTRAAGVYTAPNTCGPLSGATAVTLSGGNDSSALTTGCYQYTLTGTDNVGNEDTVQSQAIKVDTSDPVCNPGDRPISGSSPPEPLADLPDRRLRQPERRPDDLLRRRRRRARGRRGRAAAPQRGACRRRLPELHGGRLVDDRDRSGRHRDPVEPRDRALLPVAA